MSAGLLTVAQAAAVLGMSDTTAYRLIDEHTFPVPVYRIGSRWKIPAGPLTALIDGDREPGQFPAPDVSPRASVERDAPTSAAASPRPLLVGATTAT